MRIPDEVICKTCRKFFCCAKCRHKHEIKTHAIVVVQKPTLTVDNATCRNDPIYLFCPICEGKPLPLYKEMYDEMLVHVEKNHLPCKCKKCAKLYTKIDDLKEFTKCLHMSVSSNGAQECSAISDQTCDTDASKVTVTKAITAQSTISTQTSPTHRCGEEDFDNTPISIINVNWKAKSKVTHEEFISDSVSSIKNISSICNSSLRRSIGVVTREKGKLVRSTSTPVHAEINFAKPKEQTFNASGGQVSSIYNSGCESDNSPAIINSNGTPPKQPLDNINRYLKVGGRAKMTAVTPLRQVMSKSIQKAFAEHGMPTASGRGVVYNRKKIFDSIDTSALDLTGTSGAAVLAVGPRSPLDLRLSPAVRRTQSVISDYSNFDYAASVASASVSYETPQIRREILLSSQKLTTESIVITRTQHLASVESSSNRSIQTNVSSSSTGTDQSESSSSSATSNGSSVYKTCRSVEIITSTELSQVNIQQNGAFCTGANTAGECVDELRPLQTIPRQSAGLVLAPITPITRIPGAVIHKKLIHFETPKMAAEKTTKSGGGKRWQKCSPGEIFFTPEAMTPVRKSSLRGVDSLAEDADDNDDVGKQLVPRSLNGRLSPLRRPSIRDCANSAAFSSIENVCEDYENITEDYDDEVFLPLANTETVNQHNDQEELISTVPAVSGVRSWSFSSIMSSVMRLRGKENKKITSIDTDTDVNSNSIIKRCASIAGSLVRTKPLVDEEQLKGLKRKRTYTADNQYVSLYHQDSNYSSDTLPISPNADCSTTSSKRFRIQARKPIERMRMNS